MKINNVTYFLLSAERLHVIFKAWKMKKSRAARGVTGDRYYQTRQSLFFKVSYRYQF